RLAESGDVAALAALDASCVAEGSAGWSQGIYQSDVRPGGPNLILLAELPTPPPPPAAPPPATQQAAAALPGEAPGSSTSCNSGSSSSSTTTTTTTTTTNNNNNRAAGSEAPPITTSTTPTSSTTSSSTSPMVVAALVCGSEAGGEVALTNLAVAAAQRRSGLGGRMVREALRRLGAERFPAFLEVRQDNVKAQALYGKFGFQVVGVRRRYNADGSDSLVMVRQPSPL
ncbi:hypothetical protein Agub_g14505, partial [Astrephomene gubernaculifera]